MEGIRHHSHHITNQKVFDLLKSRDLPNQRLVDVGAGEGYFVSLLGAHIQNTWSVAPGRVLRACDLRPELFKYPEVRCDKMEPGGRLPYESNSFDAVTCLEVIEHVENQFHLVREFHRVTKPGGRVILSTPNVLNINSRLRYLHSGFSLLFDILPLHRQEPYGIAGHLHPISFYYLAYLFYCAQFRRVKVHFDLQKRAALPWTILCYFPLLVWHLGFRLHMKRKYRAIYEENRPMLDEINRWGMLTSRSVIIEAFK